MIEKEFIPYQEALALKELGFEEKCMASYYTYDFENFKKDQYDYRGKFEACFSDNDAYVINTDKTYYIAAPTYSQAFRFFREKFKIECHIKSLYQNQENKGYYFSLDDYTNRDFYSNPYYSYEQAELACLQKLIEICKKK